MTKKYFALMAICLLCVAIFTSACGSGGGKSIPADNSALYYLLAQQNANNNQQEENNQQANNQQEENNQQENNEQEDGIIEVTLDDDVLNKFGYQKEEKTMATAPGLEEKYYVLKKGEEEITSITIPATFTHENKTYKITKIGNKAFTDCALLANITLPDTVIAIEDGYYDEDEDILYGAFAGVGRFSTEETTINIPNGITKIGDFAFQRSGIKTIEIPSSVTIIGEGAFDASQLTTINIPSNVKTIKVGAFATCKKLTTVNISEGVTTIGAEAFWFCQNLERLDIPDSVTTIGEDAFKFVSNIYYTDREELKSQTGYPSWNFFI